MNPLRIRSRTTTQAYRDNWEEIFGKKTPEPVMVRCPYCDGQCTPAHIMKLQYAKTGDTSGACELCDNEGEVTEEKAAHYKKHGFKR